MNRIKSTRATFFCLTLLLIMFSGCSTETADSTDIATRAIWAGIRVDAETQGQSRVNVELNVGGPNGTNIDLSGNERLEASVGSEVKVLERDTDFLDIDYETSFDTSSPALPFRITFFRDDGSINNNSVVSLPPEFEISSPQTGNVFSTAGLIPIIWSPAQAGGVISARFGTSCPTLTGGNLVGSSFENFSDDGFQNFNVGAIGTLNNADIDRNQNCQLTITLERTNPGTLDSRFEAGGIIEATQLREVTGMTVTFAN